MGVCPEYSLYFAVLRIKYIYMDMFKRMWVGLCANAELSEFKEKQWNPVSFSASFFRDFNF